MELRGLAVVAALAAACGARAGVILDDFSSLTSGINTVVTQAAIDGCPGPSTAVNNGATIMNGSGTRWMTVSRSAGSGCVTATVVPDLIVNSPPFVGGRAVVLGQGGTYTMTPLDIVTFGAVYASGTPGSTSTVQVGLHPLGAPSGSGYIGAPAITLVSGPGTYSLPLFAFTLGGAVGPGTQIDGYFVIVSVGSTVTIDSLRVVTTPEASTFWLGSVPLACFALLRQKSPG